MTRNFAFTALASVGCVVFPAVAPAAEISTDVDFTTVYYPTVVPNSASPKWTLSLSQGTAAVADGILSLSTPATNGRYYALTSAGGYWNGDAASGSTIEFSLKIVSTAENATQGVTQIFFSNGSLSYNFNFSETGITTGGGQAVLFDTTSDFNVYRITLSEGSVASLYANHSATPLITNYGGSTTSSSNNQILFGDSSNTLGGVSEWEYIAFTNAGSYAPAIPEPASLGLLGVTLLVGTQLYRRRSKHRAG